MEIPPSEPVLIDIHKYWLNKPKQKESRACRRREASGKSTTNIKFIDGIM
jgi:hypothetical protein